MVDQKKKPKQIHINIPSIKQIILFFIVTLILILVSLIGYSVKVKADGDREFKNNDFINALSKYKESQKYWLPSKFGIKVNGIDIQSNISNTQKMIDSSNNYQLGLNAYNSKDYDTARKYLTIVEQTDQNYSKAQETLTAITIATQPTPVPTPIIIDGKTSVFMPGSNRSYNCKVENADELVIANQKAVDAIREHDKCVNTIGWKQTDCKTECKKKSDIREQIETCENACKPEISSDVACKELEKPITVLFDKFYKIFYNACDGQY